MAVGKPLRKMATQIQISKLKKLFFSCISICLTQIQSLNIWIFCLLFSPQISTFFLTLWFICQKSSKILFSIHCVISILLLLICVLSLLQIPILTISHSEIIILQLVYKYSNLWLLIWTVSILVAFIQLLLFKNIHPKLIQYHTEPISLS